MSTVTRHPHTGGNALFIVLATVYIGVLLLFGSQTWFFVSWLFPDTQLLMKLLTVLCFDIMAFLWALVDLFYQFASPGAKTVVRFAWFISFVLSLLASVFYLVLESMLRFSIEVTPELVNTGYGVTIFAVTLTVIFITWFLYLEWAIRHPVEMIVTNRVNVVEVQPQPAQLPPPTLDVAALKTTIKDIITAEIAPLKQEIETRKASTRSTAKKKVKGRQAGSQEKLSMQSSTNNGQEPDSTSINVPGETHTR